MRFMITKGLQIIAGLYYFSGVPQGITLYFVTKGLIIVIEP